MPTCCWLTLSLWFLPLLGEVVGFSSVWPVHGHNRGVPTALWNDNGDISTTTGINGVAPARLFIELTNPLDRLIYYDGGTPGDGMTSSAGTTAAAGGSKLPASFIASWPTWVFDTDGTWTRIPDFATNVADDGGDDDNDKQHDDVVGRGYVDPSSIKELWVPVDLKRPQMRLALGLHVRSGVIRHNLPALDVGYFHSKDVENDDPSIVTDGRHENVAASMIDTTSTIATPSHRNRGKCSVPRAFRWMEFLGGHGRYQLVASTKKKRQSTGDDKDDDEETEWMPLLHSSPTGSDITDAIQRATVALAESAPDELGDGSHIIHVILEPPLSPPEEEEEEARGSDATDVVDIPNSSHDLRVSLYLMDGIRNNGSKIETPADRERQEVASLQVVVSPTMAGSESTYLPEAYEELYNDSSLRNPVYEKFKEKQQDRRNNGESSK